MTLLRQSASCLLFAALFVLYTVAPVNATPLTFNFFPIEIRQNNADLVVGVWGVHQMFDNYEDCGNLTHRTRNSTGMSPTGGPRFFGHIHVDFEFDQHGGMMLGYKKKGHSDFDIDDDDYDISSPVIFTIHDVVAHWDHFTAWWSSGGESAKCNCYGYAFGYNTWVNNPEFIYQDDYVPVTYSMTSLHSSRDVIKDPAHVRKIDASWWDYSSDVVYINGMIEKIRSSGIYNKAYFSPPIPSHTVEIYRKR